jgi:hypothetical protein
MKATDKKSRIRIRKSVVRIRGSGSVLKCHGFTTLTARYRWVCTANMGSEVYLGNAKVSNLDDILGSDEDVLGLQVPVQNVLLVDVLQAERYLNEPAGRKKLFYIKFP